ncbi:MAG: DUF2029 domain-containing protein [Oligoflexia bacterium]|nr:DUF2029 domain-containing protein [Oligoflexia bacterium]
MFYFFAPLIIYTIIQQCFHASNPFVRLLALAILVLYFFYKKSLDSKFIIAHNELSKKQFFKKIIISIIILIISLRVIHFAYRLNGDTKHIEDVATLNFKAINVLFVDRKNPYSADIDPYPIPKEYKIGEKTYEKSVYYAGYKYTPLQLFLYAPFTLLFDLKGIYVANFLVYILIALICFLYLKKSSFPADASPSPSTSTSTSTSTSALTSSAYLGVIAFLTTDFFFTLSFNKGTNDSMPTLFLLLSLIYLNSNESKESNEKNSSSKAKSSKTKSAIAESAIMLGLSLLVKQLPASLFVLIYLVQKKYRIILFALLVFALGVLPFLIADFNSFMTQAVEFNLIRPTRETSLLSYFPPLIRKIIPFLGIVVIIILSLIGRKKSSELNLENGFALPSLALIIFLITSKMTPTHYFVWITPIIILWFFKIKRV